MTDSFHSQKHRNVAGSWYRASVFGISDGLVTNTSLILGFAGANPGHNIIRLAGLAGLVAGGFSMASGEYISVRAQKELLEYEIDVERKSIEESPDQEQEELRQLFVSRGIDADLARRLSVDLMRDPEMALRTHAREELGVDPSTTGSPWGAAISSLVFCCLGALIPLLPWILTTSGNPVLWSIGLAVLGAGVVGGVIGWFTRNGVVKWALRQILVGALAAAVTFGIGRAVGYH
ncbi:MAG TPA: VIT1/CCC1 transporter family protein [Acidimicrobiales bacterium]|jgi:VIT1/CCC1 family predicted Fe2+/Mn2+ transporter